MYCLIWKTENKWKQRPRLAHFLKIRRVFFYFSPCLLWYFLSAVVNGIRTHDLNRRRYSYNLHAEVETQRKVNLFRLNVANAHIGKFKNILLICTCTCIPCVAMEITQCPCHNTLPCNSLHQSKTISQFQKQV